MVKQNKNYIAERRKNFLTKTFFWIVIIGAIFGIGLILTHKRANVWTILAAVLAIPLAQNITRYISFRRYKDPRIEGCEQLEMLEGNLAIYHSAIIPEETATLYVDHIVVTAKKIYFLCSEPKDVKAAKTYLITKLETKGISRNEIVITELNTDKAYENICSKISKEIGKSQEDLSPRNTIIEGILM